MRLMSFYLPQVQISCWKTKMPSAKNSQTCLGLFLVHGICSASSFPIPCLESCHYGHSNTEHMDPQSKPSMHTTWMKPLREEAGLKRRRRTGQGLGQRGRTPKNLHLKRQGTLGCWDLLGHEPPQNWRSWKGVQPWDDQDGWQVTVKLRRSRSFMYYKASYWKSDKAEIFHCF